MVTPRRLPSPPLRRPRALPRLALLILLLVLGGAAPSPASAQEWLKALRPKLALNDPTLARPRKLPTVAEIDWSGFPNDARGRYGTSGRVLVVRPGKMGAIANALNNARAGDMILVDEGTYQEGLVNDFRGLPIVREGIVLQAIPGKRVRVKPRPGANYGLIIEASNVLVHGIELEGFPSAGVLLGSRVKTLSGIILSAVTVRAPADGKWHDGIVVYEDFRQRGKPVIDGLLLRNVAVFDGGVGISCNAGPCRSWWLENIKVKNASGSGWGADAIAVESGENIVMVNVEVLEASGDGIDMKARKVLIVDSNVHNVARNGIKLWNGGDIINTQIHHLTHDAALVFDSVGRYRFLNSVAAHVCAGEGRCYVAAAGYDGNPAQTVELVNSIFYKTHGGVYFGDNTRFKIKSCLFSGMRNGELLRAKHRGRVVELRTTSSKAALEGGGVDGTNRIVDPQLQSLEKADFRLKPTSPGLDAGTSVEEMPRTDRSGGPRVKGRAPDIGPYER